MLVKWDKSIEKLFQNAARSRSATSNQLRNYKGALEEVLELLQMEPEFEYHTSQQEHAIPISTSSTHYVDQHDTVRKKRLKATKTFLNLWEYLIGIIDILSYSEKSLAFDIIMLLMRRNELDPIYYKHTHTRLKKSFVKSLIRAIVPTIDQLEQDILRQYSYVVYKTQRYVIHDVLMTRRHETIYDELYVFCASVLAANCFRVIPIEDLLPFVQTLCLKFFGKQLIEYVTPEVTQLVDHNMNIIKSQPHTTTKHQSIEQLMSTCNWDHDQQKPTNPILTDTEQSIIDASLLSRLFRHTSLLTIFITNNTTNTAKEAKTKCVTEKDRQELHQWILECDTWLPSFDDCHSFFIYFFSQFCTHVRLLMEGEHTLRYWRLTPGYNELLLHYVQYGKEYLKIGGEIGIEFRQWLDATYAVLKNQRFIAVLLEMLYSSTNGLNLNEVFFTCEQTDEWFKELRTMRLAAQQLNANQMVIYYRQRIKHFESPPYPIEAFMGQVPHNFSYPFFETAVLKLIETDHFQILTRTLIMIYNCLDLFTGKERLKFVFDTLLRKNFYHLFLHWSDDVRTCFFRIICYKFQRIYRADEHKAKQLQPAQALLNQAAIKSMQSRLLDNFPPQRRIEKKEVGRRSLDQLRSHEEEPKKKKDEEEEDEEEVADVPSRKSIDAESPIQYIHASSPNLHKASRTVSHASFIDVSSLSSHESTTQDHIRNEEAIDLVIQSKTESRIAMLRSINTNNGIIPQQHIDYCRVHHEEPCPQERTVYLSTALKQLDFVQKESAQWRNTVTEHMKKKKNQLSGSGTITVIPILYPALSTPKFVLHEEEEG